MCLVGGVSGGDALLFYQVRPLAQQLTGKLLTDKYFQKLLVDYQQERGALVGLIYEPRGTMHEPHSGKSNQLGTTQVADYAASVHLYDKVLLVEKVGLLPVLLAAGLGERYDLAIMATNGYSPEASRVLAAQLHGRGYLVFTLHDADPDGYNIARTFGEATDRMPDHDIEVIDLGLTVAAAIENVLERRSSNGRRNYRRR